MAAQLLALQQEQERAQAVIRFWAQSSVLGLCLAALLTLLWFRRRGTIAPAARSVPSPPLFASRLGKIISAPAELPHAMCVVAARLGASHVPPAVTAIAAPPELIIDGTAIIPAAGLKTILTIFENPRFRIAFFT